MEMYLGFGFRGYLISLGYGAVTVGALRQASALSCSDFLIWPWERQLYANYASPMAMG